MPNRHHPATSHQSLHAGLAVVLLLLVWLTGSRATAQCQPQWLPGDGYPDVHGFVNTSAVLPNGDLVLGGNFTHVGGVPAVNLARWNGTAWSQLATGIDSTVYSLAVLPNGDLLVGGSFSTIGGIPANAIARWNGSSWSALGTGLRVSSSPGTTYSLALLPSGDIVAGGKFTSAGSVSARHVARWNGSSWSALGVGLGLAFQQVNALAIRNGNIVAGGTFLASGATTVNYIATWTGSSWSSIGSGMDAAVHVLAVTASGNLVVGGEFSMAGTVSAQSLAQWDGTAWSSIGVTGERVTACALQANGDLVVGGRFSSVGGVPANGVARWNGSTWSALGNGLLPPNQVAYADVLTIAALPGGSLVVGGTFSRAGSAVATRLARWNGTDWETIDRGADDGVRALANTNSGDLLVGGTFSTIGGVATNGLARWNGTAWASFGGGVTWPTSGSFGVKAIHTMSNGDVVVGGRFTAAGAVPANSIARWDGTAWSAMGSGMFMSSLRGDVRQLVTLQNGDLIAAGQFTIAGGVAANNIARWTGSAWAPLAAGFFNEVSSMVVLPNGDLAATSAGLVSLWNGTTWTTLPALPLGDAYALALLPSGEFVAASSYPVVYRWDGTSWVSLGLGIQGNIGGITTLAVLPDGRLVAGGYFSLADGAIADQLAVWDGTAWTALGPGLELPYMPSPPTVHAVLPLANGSLAVGGVFGAAGGHPASNFARFGCPDQSSYTVFGGGCVGGLGVPGNIPGNLPRLGQVMTANFTNLPSNAVFAILGWSNTTSSWGALPLDLGFAGAPGCLARVSPDSVQLLMGTNGSATMNIGFPQNLGFLGARLHTQGLVLDPSANAAGVVTSDAASVVVGH